MNVKRTKMPDVKSIEYLRSGNIVALAEGQTFYETPKSYEIWNENPLSFVKRISKAHISWVTTY